MPKHDSVPKKLGLNIRKRREALDFSQETLAEKAGLDQTYISGIECGKRNPGSEMSPASPRRSKLQPPRFCEGVEA